MVEPFAAVIRNSLLPARTVFHGASSSFSSATKVMTNSSHRPSQYQLQDSSTLSSIFAPLPRRAKGKEKETEVFPLHRVLQCKEWSCCPTKHFIYCTDHGLRCMRQELLSPRERPMRRSRIQQMQFANRNKSRQTRSQGSPSSQRRHVSHATQLLPRRPLSTGQPEASTSTSYREQSEKARKRLRQLAEAPLDQFELDIAWDAYSAAVELSCLSRFSVNSLILFSRNMCDKIELAVDAGLSFTKLQSWRDRLQDVIERLQKRISSSHEVGPNQQQSLQCLTARFRALCGDSAAALEILNGVRRAWRDDYLDPELGQAYDSIFASVFYYQDALHAIDFLDREFYYEYFLPPYCYSYRDPASPTSIQARHPRVLSILATIRNPLPLFRHTPHSRSKHWAAIGSILILAYCQHGLPQLAYIVYEAMRKSDLAMADLLKLRLVRALARAKDFDSAHQVIATVPSTAPEYVSTGIHLFAHQGDFRAVFAYYNAKSSNKTKRNNKVMLLYSLAVQGRIQRVRELFDELYPMDSQGRFTDAVPTVMEYAVVIYAYSRRYDPDGMGYWLKQMSDHGIEPNAHIFSAIMQSYMQGAKWTAIADVLAQMRKAGITPNAVVYTNIITALGRNHKTHAAELVFKRALKEGVKPDHAMVGALMNAYVEAGAWDEVIALFTSLASDQRGRVHLSIDLYNIVLKAYVLVGTPFRVVALLFEKLDRDPRLKPDSITFALLLQSACDAKYMQAAMDIFREIERRAEEGARGLVNAYTFTILIAGFLRKGDKERAMAMYEDMLKRGIHPTSVTFNTILSYYANEESQASLHLAHEFMTRVVNQETDMEDIKGGKSSLQVVYEPVLRGYATAGNVEGFEKLLDELLDAGGQMTVSVLSSLLDLYRRKDRLESARKVWDHLVELGLEAMQATKLITGSEKSSGSDMLCVPLSIYLDALSQAGEYEEVIRVWQEYQRHGFSFNFFNWNRLCTYLIRAGEYEQAFEVLDRVILPYIRQTSQSIPENLGSTSTPTLTSKGGEEEDKPEAGFPSPFEILNNTTLSFLSSAVASNRPLPTAKRAKLVQRRVATDPPDTSSTLASLSRGYDDGDDNEEGVPEFVRPLKTFARMSHGPARPHYSVLHDLLLGYLRLRAGQPAVPSVDPSAIDDMYYVDNTPEQRTRAHKQLSYIHSHFPDAVRAVLEFQTSEHQRLGDLYERMYVWT